ncbi:hypothetical protein C7H19_22005 [Aphanothece hegewaldii CCALA 016]|uniref:Uncharacterized protein n=1 Tax=Aphanothece hegewaldii CCALA 016 TaxID=2107694 RepID=A0A2T1LS16_9CHRO|nr:hypothetical protein [Aphanothece hegewaldii]PSF32120.1 hypothetical protein C7H19_22005 [Aphanothece hegewaldii CCALA 016]
MQRGLVWLPLLAIFIGLAWSGWNEYQKVEAYRLWAQGFENAKYDILSVLGIQDQEITFGTPRRQGLIERQTFSLNDIAGIRLLVNDQIVDLANLPNKGQAIIEFLGKAQTTSYKIPFTDIELAAKWTDYLQKKLAS